MVKCFTNLFKKIRGITLPSIVLIILVIIGFTSYSLYSDIIDREHAREDSKKYLSNLEWKVVETTLEDEVYKASIQSSSVSDNITQKILDKYSNNFNQLKDDLNSTNSNAPIYKILKNAIDKKYINKDDDKNKLLVVTAKKVLCTSYVPFTFKNGMNMYEFFNRKQGDCTINKILVDHEPYVIVEIPDGGDQYDTIDNLETLYKKSGLEGLKNIYILVASYITDDGDILGVKDSNSVGELQENNKIIIIQQVSLYEAIKTQQSILTNFEHTTELTDQSHINTINMGYYKSYMLMGLIIILSLFSVFIYQKKQ